MLHVVGEKVFPGPTKALSIKTLFVSCNYHCVLMFRALGDCYNRVKSIATTQYDYSTSLYYISLLSGFENIQNIQKMTIQRSSKQLTTAVQ